MLLLRSLFYDAFASVGFCRGWNNQGWVGVFCEPLMLATSIAWSWQQFADLITAKVIDKGFGGDDPPKPIS